MNVASVGRLFVVLTDEGRFVALGVISTDKKRGPHISHLHMAGQEEPEEGEIEL